MKKFLLLMSVLTTGTLLVGGSFLSHSKAVSVGRSGDHAQAQKLLQKAIISSPHDARLLYDAGVADFKCGTHQTAAHYFEKAAQYASDDRLQEEALFNAGNSFAHLKEYDRALQSYQKILSKNNAHERAKHNYELVKKMKEQEESPQDKQDNDQQNQDKKQNDDQKKDAGNDSQDNKSGNDKSNQKDTNDSSKNKKSDDDSNAGSDQSDQESDTDSDDESNDSQDSSPDDKKQGENGDKQHDESPADADESSNDKNDRYNNTQEDQRNGHTDPSQQQEQKPAQSNDSAGNAQYQVPIAQDQVPEELAGPDKQWMRCALEACDKQDNTHNKQLLKAVVGMDKGDRRAVRHSW